MDLPDLDWTTDKALFAALPGGQAVIEYFGYCPSFHDGVVERLELANGNASMAVRTWTTSDRVDANGYFIPDRAARVTLRITGVTGLNLVGDAGSILSELMIRRVEADPPRGQWRSCDGPSRGDIEISFDTSIGLYGVIFTKALSFELEPLKPFAPGRSVGEA